MLTSAPAGNIRCRLTATGLIELRGRYSPDFLEFVHSLPDARFNRAALAWTCRRTPMALYRLLCREGIDLGDLADEAYQVMQRVMGASNIRGGNGQCGLKQPEVRILDAWAHQLTAYHVGRSLDSACLLAMDMGTGKTKVALDLIQNWGCRSVLILCPKSVLPVWRREFERHAGSIASGWLVEVLDHGTVKHKAADAQAAIDMGHRLGGRPTAIVVNYDTAREKAFAEWSIETKAGGWDCVVCDESHRIKSHDSKQSKYAAAVGRKARHRLCLTGTPMGQSPLDLFGQFRFLDPGVFGTSFFHFRDRYATMGNPHIPQQVTGYRNQEELATRMGWLTYRCKASDVLDLPAKHHIERRFKMGDKARRIYEDMEEGLIAEIEGGVCTAANALVKLIRLQQVTSGFLVPDEGGPLDEFDDAKLTALAELVEDMPPSEPVIVFARFRHDLRRIAEVANELGRRYGELSGERRDALSDRGTLADGVTLAGVQIASGGVGIDFTAARYAVYFSLSYSLTEFDQSIARLHRPGQERPVHYYHLVAENTVDQAVYTALDKRREIVEAVLEALRTS